MPHAARLATIAAEGAGLYDELGLGSKTSRSPDEPPPPPHDDGERARVVLYRLALLTAAVSWVTCYSLDFFMTSGVSIIDGSVQASALRLADFAAGMAAILAPTGSRALVGVVLTVLGSAAAAAAVLGAAALGSLGTVLGPACLVLVGAREVYWFGLEFKGDAAIAMLAFSAVGLLRWSQVGASSLDSSFAEPPTLAQYEEATGRVTTMLDTAAEEAAELPGAVPAAELAEVTVLATEVAPVGPPVLLSFFAAVSSFTLAGGKLLEPIDEDLDEEGERWEKYSSGPLLPMDDRLLANGAEEEEAAADDARRGAGGGAGADQEASGGR